MVTRELVENLRLAFNEFRVVFKYAPFSSDSSIKMIFDHIERVVQNSLLLADDLDLNENERALAELTAQFHDIGRLWILLPANSESKITDHAEASIEYLNNTPAFKMLDQTSQNIIIQVIRNHNKSYLPDNQSESVSFYTKLLRDADKLEVWRSTSEYIKNRTSKPLIINDLNLSSKAVVTHAFCQIIIEGGIPNKEDLITFHDFIIFQMSWVFDLHYKKSFQILNQKQYIRHLYDSLPKNDHVIEIYRMIRIFIENRI
jgi:HD superfamily phosphohydrolase YqeK